jgi:signal transduction histidine kinase
MIYAAIGKQEEAKRNLDEAIGILEQHEDYNAVCDYFLSMADLYRDQGQMPTAIQYAANSLQYSKQYGIREQAANASLKLSMLYEQTGNPKEALRFQREHVSLRDSITNIQTVQQMADLRTNFEVSQKQAEVDLASQKEKDQKKVSLLLAVILGMALIITAILLINNRHRKKAYGRLNLQKQATEEQRTKAENALGELRAAQKQLIYSAKMASLGEVTAGIAHEIQNPLNFVNNFSELSLELMEELKDTVRDNINEAARSNTETLTKDLSDNLQRINYNGKRADSIVKNMLQHSRGSTGHIELVDLNSQVKESLRLSYHGARAKDETFFANTDTLFDQQIGQIKLVPQDISRALLNLFNNAFYAVNQQSKKGIPGFDPLVQVVTKKEADKITITIRDNGTGIPQGIIDKVFQPFFTTKPTGEGTGLGLSLTYEVIKAHGGELKVASEEGKFTEFVIELPLQA